MFPVEMFPWLLGLPLPLPKVSFLSIVRMGDGLKCESVSVFPMMLDNSIGVRKCVYFDRMKLGRMKRVISSTSSLSRKSSRKSRLLDVPVQSMSSGYRSAASLEMA